MDAERNFETITRGTEFKVTCDLIKKTAGGNLYCPADPATCGLAWVDVFSREEKRVKCKAIVKSYYGVGRIDNPCLVFHPDLRPKVKEVFVVDVEY